jgi:hypothetical protein
MSSNDIEISFENSTDFKTYQISEGVITILSNDQANGQIKALFSFKGTYKQGSTIVEEVYIKEGSLAMLY